VKMKLGLRISDLRNMEIKEKIDLAKECKLGAVELSAAELIDHEETKKWKALEQDNGLKITTEGIGIKLTDHEKRNEERENKKRRERIKKRRELEKKLWSIHL